MLFVFPSDTSLFDLWPIGEASQQSWQVPIVTGYSHTTAHSVGSAGPSLAQEPVGRALSGAGGEGAKASGQVEGLTPASTACQVTLFLCLQLPPRQLGVIICSPQGGHENERNAAC